MATLKQRRLRFYVLLGVIFILTLYFVLPKSSHSNIEELYPIELSTQQTIINKIKLSITPYLSNEKESIALLIELESFEYPKVIHQHINDILVVTDVLDNPFEIYDWDVLKKSDYNLTGVALISLKQPIKEKIITRFYLMDEIMIDWTVN